MSETSASAATDDAPATDDGEVATSDGGYFSPEWRAAFTGEATDDERGELLQRVGADIAAAMASPTLFDDLSRVIADRGETEITAKTWEEADRSLALLMGKDAAHLLPWLVDDPEGRLTVFAEHAAPDVAAFVRRVIARHLTVLEAMWQAWNERPLDWKIILRDVSLDVIDNRWVANLTFVHYDGTESRLETTAIGVLRLATYFLSTVRLVNSPAVYPENFIAALFEELGQTYQFFVPEGASEEADDASDTIDMSGADISMTTN